MNGVPLHPMVVHFPIVLTILLPVVALAAIWAIRRGAQPRRAWGITLVFAAALAASAFVAVRTGETEEDVVERVVAEEALHEHEELGERFQLLAAGLLVLMAAGLVGGRIGAAARSLSTLGAIALMLAGVKVAHAGGKLVYLHGAANAYQTDAGRAAIVTDEAD